VEVAKKILSKYGIPIFEEDTGGNRGRKIIFDAETGDVRVTPVNNSFSVEKTI
jgi:chemotaxis protein CheD